jgi:hypothetical protein
LAVPGSGEENQELANLMRVTAVHAEIIRQAKTRINEVLTAGSVKWEDWIKDASRCDRLELMTKNLASHFRYVDRGDLQAVKKLKLRLTKAERSKRSRDDRARRERRNKGTVGEPSVSLVTRGWDAKGYAAVLEATLSSSAKGPATTKATRGPWELFFPSDTLSAPGEPLQTSVDQSAEKTKHRSIIRKELETKIGSIMRRERPDFDFDRWRKKRPKRVNSLLNHATTALYHTTLKELRKLNFQDDETVWSMDHVKWDCEEVDPGDVRQRRAARAKVIHKAARATSKLQHHRWSKPVVLGTTSLSFYQQDMDDGDLSRGD